MRNATEDVVEQNLDIPTLITGSDLGWVLLAHDPASTAPDLSTVAFVDAADGSTDVTTMLALDANLFNHTQSATAHTGTVSSSGSSLNRAADGIIEIDIADIDLGTVNADDTPARRIIGLWLTKLTTSSTYTPATDEVIAFIDNGNGGSDFPFEGPGANVTIQIASTGIFRFKKA